VAKIKSCTPFSSNAVLASIHYIFGSEDKMQTEPRKYFTPEQYLEMERNAGYKKFQQERQKQ